MMSYERIAAEAAELARQFWLEIEAEFTQQIAQYQHGGAPGERPAATQREPAIPFRDALGPDHRAGGARVDETETDSNKKEYNQ